jgi:putative lysine/arginine/ornithine/histidine/octopine transport system permease protein
MPDLILYFPSLMKGLKATLLVCGMSVVGAVLVGLSMMLLYLSKNPLAVRFIHFYTTVFRSIPEILIIFMLFFGTSIGITFFLKLTGLGQYYQPNPLVAGVAALTLTFGAYATEIFRAAFLAVPRGDIDAAYSLGMERRYVYGHIVIPEMLRFALPGLSNLTLVMLKDSALLSVIGVNELLRQTKVAISVTKAPFTFYLTAAGLYLLTTIVLLALLAVLRRYALRGWPTETMAKLDGQL